MSQAPSAQGPWGAVDTKGISKALESRVANPLGSLVVVPCGSRAGVPSVLRRADVARVRVTFLVRKGQEAHALLRGPRSLTCKATILFAVTFFSARAKIPHGLRRGQRILKCDAIRFLGNG